VRQEVYDTYWRLAAERQLIFTAAPPECRHRGRMTAF
jgi:hypothetical protein